MGFRRIGPAAYAAAGLAAAALLLTACGGSSSGGGSSASGGASPAASGAVGTAPSGGPGATTADFDTMCAQLKQFGDIKGKTVSVYTGIVAPEDALYQKAFDAYTQCTGAKVSYEGDKTFEAQILVRVKAGNPPDIGIVPQPGLLKQLVATGKAVEAPKATADNVDKYFGKSWKDLGSVDGKFYAGPNSANVKSLVWYSPKTFTDNGWKIPTTLDELKTLSDTIAASGKMKPWCAGIGSGEATGWPVTDWMEDMMLRLYGAETYDKWVNHTIPFNGPESTAALDAVGQYLKNDKYVNGGIGNVKSIATTTFQNGGLPILDNKCAMHRQANFYATIWPKGTTVANDGQVYAFYFPAKDTSSKPVLGGGEFMLGFSNKPEVQAFQTFVATPYYANLRAQDASSSGGFVSANNGLLQTSLKTPIDQLTAAILQDPKAVFRFDGSDQMPAAVGSDAFWKQATSWITGQDTKNTVDKIEAAWPKS
jgi:alpha-glucoside transport system substrate-binding protein